MAKRRDYHLNKDELAELEAAIHHDERPEVRQRGLAIRQLHLGQKAEEVAELHAVSKPTIYGWWQRWCDGGVEGLANRPKSSQHFFTGHCLQCGPLLLNQLVYLGGGRGNGDAGEDQGEPGV